MDIRFLREAVDRKRGPLDRLVEEHQARQDRKNKLEQDKIYNRDRTQYWETRAEQLEQEAQKAREKAQKATERREQAQKVLDSVDWDKDAQERVERAEGIERMESIIREIQRISTLIENSNSDIEIQAFKDTQNRLVKEFKSAKGRGV